jgi:branched-chain amino acid transport system ATP-binding protein
MSLLTVEHLDARHGLMVAVQDVSFELDEGSTLALVGANGAGKTTLLRSLAGAHKLSGGRVVFDGDDISALRPHDRVERGMALVPEGRKLFANLTVEENLRVAGRVGRKGPWNVERVFELFPMLRPLRRQRASTLSGGQQQATAIGRALMTNPRLLLLDEVSLGLAPVVVDSVYGSVGSLIESGTTIVLVEQSVARVMEVASQISCLVEGRIVLSGTPSELSMEQITDAYFGVRGRGTGTGRD